MVVTCQTDQNGFQRPESSDPLVNTDENNVKSLFARLFSKHVDRVFDQSILEV